MDQRQYIAHEEGDCVHIWTMAIAAQEAEILSGFERYLRAMQGKHEGPHEHRRIRYLRRKEVSFEGGMCDRAIRGTDQIELAPF
jgi:hypothetical protein